MTDMTGKTVLVTGATNGVGEATATALAAKGARVLVHGRNADKGATVVAAIKRVSHNDAVEFVAGNLADLASVRAMAAEVLARAPRLDVLVNNAGGLYTKRSVTMDGFESSFGVNHLAPFLLTNLLLDRLKASAPARIVNVSSVVHKSGRVDFDDLQSERKYSFMGAYSQSKLANILFTRALTKRLQGTRVTANALHPGAVRSGLGQQGGGATKLLSRVIGVFFLSPEQGARTSVYLSSAPEVEGISGDYFAKCKNEALAGAALDDAAAEKLWSISAKMCGLA
jgi:NAD(P)-dependent dehydrogenase (short-subunit alcohol dehydrogenase family)